MRTTTIVSRVITDCKDYMHLTRWQRLVDLSSAALNGQALALTQLALGSASQTTLRHRVKAVDRLLGSASFAAEHLDIYRIYEEVHPRRRLAAYAVHQRFLERLACVLPMQMSAPA